MNLEFSPAGGRYGTGFDYYCAECGDYVGNSGDERLTHDATTTTGIFRKKTVKVDCVNAGKVCEVPKHTIEAKEISA